MCSFHISRALWRDLLGEEGLMGGDLAKLQSGLWNEELCIYKQEWLIDRIVLDLLKE